MNIALSGHQEKKMTAYTIRIDYLTGDSFGSYDTSEEIGYSFYTKEEAEDFLKVIEHHLQLCRILDKCKTPEQRKAVCETYSYYPWFFDNSTFGPDYQIKYHNKETGQDDLIRTFWIGYFEHLYSATVVEFNNAA